MKIPPFAIERYFARYEFSARYLLSSSDCEAYTMSEILAMADEETRRLWDTLTLGYTESAGHPLLRQAAAGMYDGIDPDDILVTVPEEGIFLLMHAVLEPGAHVVCTFPGYQSLYEVARSMGCKVSTWEPAEGRGWHFDVQQLENLLRPETKLVIVNFPHNPTGCVLSLSEYARVVGLARDRGIHLLSDEMYRFLEIDDQATLPAGCEVYDRAVSLFGLSKTFGLPGLRIGWMATRHREVLEEMARLKDYTTICSSAPSEILALIAVRSRARIIREQRDRLHRNLKVLDQFFRAHGNFFDWHRPAGGSICFPRVRFSDDTNAFCEELVRETGILLAPSRIFHYGDLHVRVGFGRENLPEALEGLADYLDRRFR